VHTLPLITIIPLVAATSSQSLHPTGIQGRITALICSATVGMASWLEDLSQRIIALRGVIGN